MQSIMTIDPAKKSGIASSSRRNGSWSPYVSETIDLSKIKGNGPVYFEYSRQICITIRKYQPDFIGFEMPLPKNFAAARMQLAMIGIIEQEIYVWNCDFGWCYPNKIKEFHLGKKDAARKGSKERVHEVVRRRFAVGENMDETDAIALLDLIVTTQATGELSEWLNLKDIK